MVDVRFQEELDALVVTLEVSQEKNVDYSQIKIFWENSKNTLISGAVVRILRGTISGIYGNFPDISRRILTRPEKSGAKCSSLIELNKLLFFSYTSSTYCKFHENGL
jgi:hypothetical protein